MKIRSIVLWVVSGLLALAFFGASLAKFTSQPMMVAEFEGFGYPLGFMYLTGVLEFIGAVLVLIPRLAFIGAGLLSCVMVGALFSHLTHGQGAMIGAPFVLLILALVVGTLRNWGRSGLTASRA